MFSTKEFEVVCPTDPAVDVRQSKIDRYLLRRQLADLTFFPGKEPTRFWLRRVPYRLVTTWIDTPDEVAHKHVRAFLASVVSWSGRWDALTEKQVTTREEPAWVRKQVQDGVMSIDELDLFHPELVQDVGAVAYERCFLRPGREALYAVPPSLQPALQRVLSQFVAEKIDARSLSFASSDSRVPQHEETGDEATTATASEKTGAANEASPTS